MRARRLRAQGSGGRRRAAASDRDLVLRRVDLRGPELGRLADRARRGCRPARGARGHRRPSCWFTRWRVAAVGGSSLRRAASAGPCAPRLQGRGALGRRPRAQGRSRCTRCARCRCRVRSGSLGAQSRHVDRRGNRVSPSRRAVRARWRCGRRRRRRGGHRRQVGLLILSLSGRSTLRAPTCWCRRVGQRSWSPRSRGRSGSPRGIPAGSGARSGPRPSLGPRWSGKMISGLGVFGLSSSSGFFSGR